MSDGDDAARTEPRRNWGIVEDLVETTLRGIGESRDALHCGTLALARLESAGYEVHSSHHLDDVRRWFGEAILEARPRQERLDRVVRLIDYGARPAPQAEIGAGMHYVPSPLKVGPTEDPAKLANGTPPDQSPRGATHRRPVTKPDPSRAPESSTNWDPAKGHWPPTRSGRQDGPETGMG